MDLSVLFLGTAGSMPTVQRAPSSLLIRRGGDRILIDCGEGAQRQLLRSVGLPELEHVFITHYHADHFLGLPGMLKTFALRGRELPIKIYGPRGLQSLMSDLRRIYGKLSYPLQIRELEGGETVEFGKYRLGAFTVDHGATTALGYALVEEMRPGRFDTAAARKLGVPEGPQFGLLQRGESIEVDGRRIAPEQVLGEGRPGRLLVFSGDTRPCESTAAVAEGANLLVHEGTFSIEEADRAKQTGHSTALEAAQLAGKAQVSMLAITHLSPRYFAPEIRKEAELAFPNTVVPRDFDVIEVPFAERGKPELHRWKDYRHRLGPEDRAERQPEDAVSGE